MALADKLHNARSIVRDHRDEGDALWRPLRRRTADDQLWHGGRLLACFEERRPGPLTEDLRRAVMELARLTARDRGARQPL